MFPRSPRYSRNPPGHRLHALRALISENRVLGGYFGNQRKKAAFSLDDMELMMTLAGHAAALINNVRLYDQMKEAQRRRRRSGEFAQRDYRRGSAEEDRRSTAGGGNSTKPSNT